MGAHKPAFAGIPARAKILNGAVPEKLKAGVHVARTE